MVEQIKNISDMLNPEILVKNIYLYSLLVLFLTMYGPRLHPKLPSSLRNLFDNYIFRAIILFLISYLSIKNFSISLVIAIIFIFIINLLNTENVLNIIKNEGFTINGPPVSSCNIYNKDSFNLVGTAFYPMSDNNQLLSLDSRNDNDNYLKYNNEIQFKNK